MMASRSITRILLVRLAALFLLAPVVASLLILIVGEQDTNPRIDTAMESKTDALTPLLHFDRNDKLVLDSRALATSSELRFAVYRNDAHRPVLHYPADLKLRSWDFVAGYQTVRNVNGHPLRLLFAPPTNSWNPWLHWFADELTDETLPLLTVLMAISLPLAALSVRFGLKPVRTLSLEAAKIDPGEGHARLSEENVPIELLPLVRAVNGGLERLDAGIASQQRFSAIVAHELRTPLAVLLMQLEREPWTSGAARAREQLQRLSRLVDQLLTISELTAKRVKVDATVDGSAIVRAAVAQAVPPALDAGVIVEFDGPEAPMLLKGNAAAISTALRNLIDNAVRHSRPGDHVVARLLPASSAIEICDQGPGIDGAQRERIFEPFWKKPSSKGRGLGLAIAREMAELHRAKISVRSNKPRGSIFRIDFPRNGTGPVIQRERARSSITPAETVGPPETNPLPL
jgi:signal transduction histidine kinase